MTSSQSALRPVVIASMKSAMTAATGSGRLDELEAGQIDDHLLLDVGNAAVDDAALDDDGAVAEGEPKIVKGIEL